MFFTSPAEAAAWLTQTATGFMKSPANDIHLPGASEPAFALPLVEFAAGDDPIWDSYKAHAGVFHWTPLEAFSLGYPGEKVSPSELTVMSWVLPQTDATLRDQRKGGNRPAERWVRSRIYGEKYVHDGLRKHLLEALHAKGIQAVSPSLLPEWKQFRDERFVFASNWSERHAAFAAGHGTFGLCDGLITKVGKAMRAGSLVVRLEVSITPRPYTHHQEYCLFYNSGVCGVCIKRCPAGALSPEGHDKLACSAFLSDVTMPYTKEMWGFDGYGCGLCQVNVPCERRIPPKPGRQKARQETGTRPAAAEE